MQKITAAGGVVYKQSSGNNDVAVLLIHRRGVWDLPKGKKEKNESMKECALREVAEEVGLNEEPRISFNLITTYHEYMMQKKKYGKSTHWFAMELNSPEQTVFTPQKEEGIDGVQWFPQEQAINKVGYENLADVLKKVRLKL